MEVQAVKEIGRADKFVFYRELFVGFTRALAWGDPQQRVEIAKQARIELPQPVKFRVGGDQIRAVGSVDATK